MKALVNALVGLVGLCCLSLGATAAEIAPVGAGPWAVASANFEVTEPTDAPMSEYLDGRKNAKMSRYISDVLLHPETAVVARVTLPEDHARFGKLAGVTLPLAMYVLYPTTSDNGRPDYPFPYAKHHTMALPHMQRAGEKLEIARAGGGGGGGTKWPLVVFSHGYATHGLWQVEQLKKLASHGYVVASVFHGDGRMSFETGVYARPLELRAAIDFLLGHPDFGPAIDAERVGVSGSSFGGYTVLTALGGSYLGEATTPRDPRIKAGFGLVPFMGARFGWWLMSSDVWPFGKDFAGLRTVRAPFLAVYGGSDGNVRPESVEAGVRQIGGPVSAVRLGGEKHALTDAVWSDVETWEILFFDAWLKGDAEARRRLYGATSVAGGVRDERTYLHAGVSAER